VSSCERWAVQPETRNQEHHPGEPEKPETSKTKEAILVRSETLQEAQCRGTVLQLD